jgi:hypothetical protein
MNQLAKDISKRRQSSYLEQPTHPMPSIIVTGVVDDITHALNQRGFIPVYSLLDPKHPTEVVLVLKVSPKLYMKTAIELGYPLLDISDSKDSHVARVLYKTISILMRMKYELHNFEEAWLMQELKVINRTKPYASDYDLLTDINTYYGSKTALFFAYQLFQQQYMCIPACVGALLFAYQLFVGEVDTRYNPLFMLMIVMWTIILLRMWYRESSSLCFEWGVTDADDKRIIKEAAKVCEINTYFGLIVYNIECFFYSHLHII